MMKLVCLIAALAVVLIPRASADTFSIVMTGPVSMNGTIVTGAPYPCPQVILGEGPMLSFTGDFNGNPMTLLNPGPPNNCPAGSLTGIALSGFLPGGRGLDPNFPPYLIVGESVWKIQFDDFPVQFPWTLTDVAGIGAGTTFNLSDSEVTITQTAEPSIYSLLAAGLFMVLLAKGRRTVLNRSVIPLKV